MRKSRSGFTLVEILVVLGIIALLSALLFPVFKGVLENGKQTTCQSNLKQIYLAVRLYYQDEKQYPDSVLDLMGDGVKYSDGAATPATATIAPGKGTGYFKGGQDDLTCPDDDSLSSVQRASYGYLSKGAPATLPASGSLSTYTGDLSQYVWNYWGYRDDGFAYTTAALAAAACPTAPCPYLVTTTATHAPSSNPIKYSLSNRFAPTSTIITHCIYHRIPTSKGLNAPGELYATPANDANSKDIVLRLDGSTRPIDVSTWKTSSLWQNQIP